MNVVEIVFSPTGGTEKVADIIGKHWNEDPAKIDLSDAKKDFSKCEVTEQDMAVIAIRSVSPNENILIFKNHAKDETLALVLDGAELTNVYRKIRVRLETLDLKKVGEELQ